ncbi:MAG: restriction endonuclease subunit S [Ignavibacteria bacterium]|nr:restriction endonuclease subunit S [Ignavibacteria bacterium]
MKLRQAKLPKGWEMKKLGEVCDELFAGGDVPKDNYSKAKSDVHNFPIYSNGEKNKGLYGFTNVIRVNKPSITISARGTIGYSEIRKENYYPVIRLIVVIPRIEILDLFFLNYVISSIDFTHSGSSIPQLTVPMIKEYPIPVPPLPEQKLIVAILDKAFAAIAKAKANAEQNLKNTKELFESYLQSVFDPSTRSGQGSEGWEDRRLGESDLIEIIDGDRGKNYPTQKDFNDEGFCLFINTKNVRPTGFEFNTTMFISEAKDKSMGKGKLRRNDVVMTTRGTIGNLGVYNEEVEYENIRINSGMLIFRPNQKQITSDYLFEILRSGIIKEQIKKQVTGAAQPQLPIKTLVNFIFPVPKSIKAQQTIVKKLDALSAETKKLEAIYQQKINDLEELKKSILQKAFSGELKTTNAIAL